jgi:poly(A) polymerase
LIGDPDLRYREDPVRLLRAARFVAKLGVEPDQATVAPIRQLAVLLGAVPPARLFEEVCKLFLTGHGVRSLETLQRFGLTATLFPAMGKGKSTGQVEVGPLLRKALENTDSRLLEGKPVTPAFLFAALLWQPVRDRTAVLVAQGISEQDACMVAADEVFSIQACTTAVPRRFSAVTRQIWSLQPRFHKTSGKRWKRLFSEQRFRAAYDFLLLRAAEDPSLQELGVFWTEAQKDLPEVAPASVDQKSTRRRRPRRRRPAGQKT